MTVSILFITHSGIGLSIMTTLNETFGPGIMEMQELSVGAHPDPELLGKQALIMVKNLNQGEGVLVFTDMIGSTPCNVAQKLVASSSEVRIVSGVNLPMMFRVFNYHHLPLSELVQKALNAGREGILEPVKDPRIVLVKANRTKKLPLKHSPKKYDKKTSSNS